MPNTTSRPRDFVFRPKVKGKSEPSRLEFPEQSLDLNLDGLKAIVDALARTPKGVWDALTELGAKAVKLFHRKAGRQGKRRKSN